MDYKTIYQDFYSFHLKYKDNKKILDIWSEVVDEGETIAKKYGNSKFAIDLMLSIFDELKRNAVMQE